MKQKRQPVLNRENVDFFTSVIQKFLDLKEKNTGYSIRKKSKILVWELILMISFVILND